MSHSRDDSRPVPLLPVIFAADSEPCRVRGITAIARLDAIYKVCNRRAVHKAVGGSIGPALRTVRRPGLSFEDPADISLLLQHRVQSGEQLLVMRDEPIVGAELVPLENALDVEVILLRLTQC